MKITKTKILAFFIAILILGWFLYPKELFLGYIFEGRKELSQSEKYYREHLKKHPHNKFATTRLAGIYERLAQPEKGIPLLEELYQRRRNDWEAAVTYLDFMENVGDPEALHKLRLRVARDFLKVPRFSKRRIESLLQPAMEYLLWQQRLDEAMDILKQLIAMAKDPRDALYLLLDIDQGLKKTAEVIALLEKRLAEHPEEAFLRIDLALVYEVKGNFPKGLAVLNEGLKLQPESSTLLKARMGLFKKHKEFDAAIRDAEFLLSLKGIDAEERPDLLETLASLYEEKKDREKALRLYTEVWRQDPLDPRHWQNIIFLHEAMGHLPEFVKWMEDYLEKFPDDEEMEKTLADATLYRLKDPVPFDFYLRHVQRHHAETFALDVADLYLKEKMKGEEERWLQSIFPIFPGSLKIFSRTVAFYERELRLEEAIALCRSRLKTIPRAVVLAKLVNLNQMAGHLKESRENLAQLRGEKISDPEILKIVGRELLGSGHILPARRYFHQAREKNPHDAELLFWMKEDSSVVALLEPKGKRDSDEERYYLTAKARQNFSLSFAHDYQALRKKFPDDIDFYSDWIDLLLENKKYAEAASELELAEEKFPQENRLWRSYALRSAAVRKDWSEAIALSKELSEEYPQLWVYRKNLAESYAKNGEWRKAIAEYEALQGSMGEEEVIAAPLRDLHALSDTRMDTQFHLLDLGADELMEWQAAAKTFLTEKWELLGEFQGGIYRVPIHPFEDDAETGKIMAGFSPNNHWTFRAGGGFGVSPSRTVPTGFAEVHFRLPDQLHLSLEGNLNKLRTDTPPAVGAGAVVHRTELNAEYFWGRRITLKNKYEFRRSDLLGPAHAYEHLWEPSAAVLLLKRPALTLGYQYTFGHVFDKNNFTGPVPLVPRIRAHYLAGDMSHRFRRNFILLGGFFAGEDPVRDLSLIEGDLYGVNGGVVWNVTRGLDFSGSYHYSKERTLTTSGQSQEVFLKLSGHY